MFIHHILSKQYAAVSIKPMRKLLNDYSDKPLSELQMPNDVFDLYKTKIFTRTNVEGLVDKQNVISC